MASEVPVTTRTVTSQTGTTASRANELSRVSSPEELTENDVATEAVSNPSLSGATSLQMGWLDYIQNFPPPPFPLYDASMTQKPPTPPHFSSLDGSMAQKPLTPPHFSSLDGSMAQKPPTPPHFSSLDGSMTQKPPTPPHVSLFEGSMAQKPPTPPHYWISDASVAQKPPKPPEQVASSNIPKEQSMDGTYGVELTTPEVCTAGNTFFVEIKVGRKRCHGLLDTGSEVTLLPKRYAKNLAQLRPVSRTLSAANGTLINVLGEWRTEVTLGPVRVPMNFIVSDQTDELLIGVDWLRDNRCLLSFENFTLTLHGHSVQLLKKNESSGCNRITLEETVELPAESEVMVRGKMVYSNLQKRPPEVAVAETKECRPGVKTARCLIDVRTGMSLPIRLINTNRTAVSLTEGTPLCSLDEVDMVVDAVKPPEPPGLSMVQKPPTPPEPPEPPEPPKLPMALKSPGQVGSPTIDPVKREQINKLVFGVHSEVSPEHAVQLEQLLCEYADIISRDEFDMGLTDLVQHEIDTGQEKPVRQSSRKTPLAYNEVIDKHVQSMLKQGLIEPSSSDWASNIVLVLKKESPFVFA